MTSPQMPPVDDDLHVLWAKSSSKPNEKGESLAEHTWAVLCRLADQYRLHPSIASDIEAPRFWHWAYWGVFLHDFGKAAEGFQNVLKGKASSWGYRHEALSLAFVEWVFPPDHPDYAPVIAMIATHHRDANDIINNYRDKHDPEMDHARHVVRELFLKDVRRLYDWLVHSGEAWAQALGFADVIDIPVFPSFEEARKAIHPKTIHRAVTVLKDYTSHMSFQADTAGTLAGTLLRGLILTADHAGSAHTKPFSSAGLTHEQVMIMLGDRPLFDHQQSAANAPKGSMLLISPTSSGKTEAALLWLAQQEILDGRPAARVFYTLPYQASMNAMSVRLKDFFPAESVGLQHSRMLQSLYHQTLTSQGDPNFARAFALQQKELARLHHFPVNLVSPYHLLKVPYQLKGFEALLTHFYGGRFILDEIHAYDPQRMALILAMLRFLHQVCQARFFIMTATLAPHIAQALQDALPDLRIVTATPQTFQRFQRHRVHVLDGDLLHPAVVERIVADAADKSVLVCCNTVGRAADVYRALSDTLITEYGEAAPSVILLHSRFTNEDRNRLERLIRERTGVGGQRLRTVVVSTQVVEVSLNIDLDTLYSEAAPLEALLQRFGRINRGRPPGSSLADVYVVREQPDVVERIYAPLLIYAALQCLTSADGTPIDEARISNWLAQVYQGEALAEWQTTYKENQQTFETQVLQHLAPFDASGFDDLFYRMFDGVDVLPTQFLERYETHVKAGEFFEASALLVPVAWRDYDRLKRRGLAWPESRSARTDRSLFIVDVPYTSESGLDLKGSLTPPPIMEAD